MKFLKLTTIDGNEVLINPDNICAVAQYYDTVVATPEVWAQEMITTWYGGTKSVKRLRASATYKEVPSHLGISFVRGSISVLETIETFKSQIARKAKS